MPILYLHQRERISSDFSNKREDEKLEYTIKSTYSLLSNEVGGEYRVLYEQLWSINALPSTQIVTWRVLLERLPTRVNMEGR